MDKFHGVLSGTNVKGLYDYVDDDGNLHLNNEARSVMIRTGNDLEDLDGYLPGAIAYTAGFESMWQLSADGEWVSMTAAETEITNDVNL